MDSSEEGDPTPLSLTDFDDIVEILVGESGTRFRAHAFKLVRASDYFKAACSPAWECGRRKSINLEDQSPHIFAIFMGWLLENDLSESESYTQIRRVGEKSANLFSEQWSQMVQCYILGDFLRAPTFKNRVIDQLLLNQEIQAEEYGTIIGSQPQDILLVWANTVPNSPLRRIILDHSLVSGDCSKLACRSPCPEFHEYLCELLDLHVQQRIEAKVPKKPWAKHGIWYYE